MHQRQAARVQPLDCSSLAEPLRESTQRAWAAVVEAAEETQRPAIEALLGAADFERQLLVVLACSRFAAETLRRRPWLLLQLSAAGSFELPLREGALTEELGEQLARGEESAAVVLRRFRQRQMLRIIWRDLNRLATTLETTRDVSWLAEACLQQAIRISESELTDKLGTPRGAHSGEHQELVVLAMGKLGAHELNLSSDIDLIFAYPESGTTEGGRRSVSNEEYFTRLGRTVIGLLDPVTAEGFVFRVDMRLRPYGESGALVHSFAALESYYQQQGRDWERYALVKARPISGSRRQAEALMECLQPFVYRRYVDFSAIESLRSMKALIVSEVRRRGLQSNVKLGSGGIREVEFIGQCFQLIRGGRDATLQRRELIPVLAECAILGCLPEEVSRELQAAYLFLRDVEHAIQAWEDRQTQELPDDELARAALAQCMGFAGFDAFATVLAAHREVVARHFAELIAAAPDSQPDEANAELWGSDCDAERLEELGFGDVEPLAEMVEALYASRRVQSLQPEGRERLDRFMPLLLQACAESEHANLALERALPLVKGVIRRSAYLLLLIENPPALADLVSLCGGSPWIAEQLAAHPALLDELLDRSSLYTAPDRDSLQADLRQQLARLTVEDLEGHMDALRYFQASQVLRVAASELAGRLPLMKVSDRLSFIAEVVVSQVLALAYAQMTARYGAPSRGDAGGGGFSVLAYGKLGGFELSYSSDLDLVFLYDAAASGYTDGERAIDNTTFYVRLAQRMIHILEARMGLGQLYDVDLRLRPSGASGLLVTSLAAFERYQYADAWTWEHQALVRARTIAGDAELNERVESLRREILGMRRDPQLLTRQVIAMREKMRGHMNIARDDPEFDLKQGVGGIVDIEFMVQYAVLVWAFAEPSLADWSDNVRILETLATTGYLPQSQCQALVGAYLELRSATHRLALQQQTRKLPAAEFAAERASVQSAWSALFGESVADCGEAELEARAFEPPGRFQDTAQNEAPKRPSEGETE